MGLSWPPKQRFLFVPMNSNSFLSSKPIARFVSLAGPVLAVFAVVYAASLTFVYIEGDDATSVAYHAMGRQSGLQPAYSAYHGMMDVFLAWLPANESLVRHAAMSITAAGAVVMVILILALIRRWLGPSRWQEHSVTALLLLVCTPEIFYLGLVYTPSLVAMCFVLSAHLVIRHAFDSYESTPSRLSFTALFVVSSVLFGIGVACRWDIGVYLFFIFADLILGVGTTGGLKRALPAVMLWSGAAFVMSLVAITLSGYGLAEIQSTLALAREEILVEDSWFALFGAYQTFFTPAFVALMLVGFVVLVRSDWKLGLVCVAGLVPVLPFLLSREPKMILPALPGLWLALAAGLRFALNVNSYRWLVRSVVLILAAAPWVIGLRVDSAETSWGPGFAIKTPAAVVAADSNSDTLVADKVDRRNVAVRKWNLGFSGGFAIPTPEGPRPLGGHLSVLLGGEWRGLHSDLDRERARVIETATETGSDLLQDEGNSLLVAKLLERGFSTHDPKVDYAAPLVTLRRFVNREGTRVDLLLLRKRGSLFEADEIDGLLTPDRTGRVVLFSGYSSTIRKLVDQPNAPAIPLGPFSAVVDVKRLADGLDRQAPGMSD